MNQNSTVAQLVATRGNRCTAAILGYLEDYVYTEVPEITTGIQKQIRQVVLDQVNGFKDIAIDVVKSDASLINEMWVQELGKVRDELKHIRSALNGA